MKFLLTSLILCLSIALNGCGGSSSNSTTSVTTIETVKLVGKVTDGALGGVKVSLASLRKGSISNTVITSSDGSYTLEIAKSILSNLNDKDLPYIYATSTNESKVTTSGGKQKKLVANQVRFRSFVSVSALKTLAKAKSSTIKNDSSLQTDSKLKKLAQGLTISHISNAKALLVEAKLKKIDPVKFAKPITPDNFDDEGDAKVDFTDDEIDAIDIQIETIELALETAGSPELKKLKLISAATKQIVEFGKANIIKGGALTSLEDSLEILLDLADDATDIDDEFAQDLALLADLVNDDFDDEDLKDFFSDSTIFTTISTSDALASTAIDLSEVIYSIAEVFPCRNFSKSKCDVTLNFNGGTTTQTLKASLDPTSNSAKRRVNYVNSNASFAMDYFSNGKINLVLGSGASVTTIPVETLTLNKTISIATGITMRAGEAFFSASIFDRTTSIGRFYPVTITGGFELVFGEIPNSDGEFTGLGIVQIKGLFDSTTTYKLSSATIEGQKFPVELGTSSEAINLIADESVDGINSALLIANEMIESGANTNIKKQGHLIFSITNLAAHFTDNSNPDTSLGTLLNKLNFAQIGRNVFNFTSKLTKKSDQSLSLGDLKGFFDIQAYFVDGDTSLLAALNDSISSLDFILSNTTDSTDSVLIVDWQDETITFQKKDIYAIKAGMNALSFIINYIAAHDFDLTDDARNAIFSESTETQTVEVSSTFAKAIEFASNEVNQESLKTRLSDEKILDAFKDTNSNLLGFRNNSNTTLNNAKLALMSAFENSIFFLDVIKGENGGSKTSAFYVDANDLEDIVEDKKALLSIWNNLNGGYHLTFTINGKTGANWYTLDVKEGEVLEFLVDSTEKKTTGFDFNYVYSSKTSQNRNTPQAVTERDFIKISLQTLFNTSFRQLILNDGSVNASSITTLDYFEDETNFDKSIIKLLNAQNRVVSVVETVTGLGSTTTVTMATDNIFFTSGIGSSTQVNLFDNPSKYTLYIRPNSAIQSIYFVSTPTSSTENISFEGPIITPSISNPILFIEDKTNSTSLYYRCDSNQFHGTFCHPVGKFDFLTN